jgi:hypothetical protein
MAVATKEIIAKLTAYSIESFENGFRITRNGLLDAGVKDIGAGLEVCTLSNDEEAKSLFTKKLSCGYYQYRSVVEHLAEAAGEAWVTERKKTAKNGHVPKKLIAWAKEKFKKSISKAIHAEWKRLLEKADPKILAVQKKFFVVRGPKARIPPVLLLAETYQDETFLNDLLAYNPIHYCLDASEIKGEHRTFKNDWNYGPSFTNWRLVYSNTPHTYKALNRTLDQCPRGIPGGILGNLSKIHLRDAVTDRIKLICVCTIAGIERYHRHLDCIMRSSPEQIKKAFRNHKKSSHLLRDNKKFCLRGHKSIRDFIMYTCDYDGNHAGEIVGLLEKSNEWHRNEDARLAAQREAYLLRTAAEREAYAKEMEPTNTTKLPPVPLPTNQGIRFLATVQDVLDEGKLMGHCIGSYAHGAVKGQYYLFHSEKDDTIASTMVDTRGRVVQSYGPKNVKNDASEWAERVLGKWGKEVEAATQEAWDKEQAEIAAQQAAQQAARRAEIAARPPVDMQNAFDNVQEEIGF